MLRFRQRLLGRSLASVTQGVLTIGLVATFCFRLQRSVETLVDFNNGNTDVGAQVQSRFRSLRGRVEPLAVRLALLKLLPLCAHDVIERRRERFKVAVTCALDLCCKFM